MINRAFKFTSSELLLNLEKHGFSLQVVEKLIKGCKNKNRMSSNETLSTSILTPKYISLPFINQKLTNKVKALLHPHNVRTSFKSSKNLYSLGT